LIKEIAIDLMWLALMLGSIGVCVFLVCFIGLMIKKFIDGWNKASK